MAPVCAALAATLPLHTLPALAADQIKLVLFASTPALPLYVARDQGFFAAHGLEVSFTRTPDSPFLIKGMAEGAFDLGFAGLDNFVAYQEGQHVAPYKSAGTSHCDLHPNNLRMSISFLKPQPVPSDPAQFGLLLRVKQIEQICWRRKLLHF